MAGAVCFTGEISMLNMPSENCTCAGHEVPWNKEKSPSVLRSIGSPRKYLCAVSVRSFDSFYEPSVFLATTRLMHRLAQMFEEEKWKAGGSSMQVEGKLRSRIREKRRQWGINRMMKLRVRIYHEEVSDMSYVYFTEEQKERANSST